MKRTVRAEVRVRVHIHLEIILTLVCNTLKPLNLVRRETNFVDLVETTNLKVNINVLSTTSY